MGKSDMMNIQGGSFRELSSLNLLKYLVLFAQVTDMDRIEVSNLSRQFLFRQNDVGHPKSVRGAMVVKKWNPQINIEALEKKVGDDTEDFFNDQFWESLSVCWNALDNVQARQFTDARCLFYSKPLLESGTLGTKVRLSL